jgi:Tfp pilus assembly protein FimV
LISTKAGRRRAWAALVLEVVTNDFYCRAMKRIVMMLATFALAGSIPLQAQDAATEERLNKLSGQIEDLIAGQKAQQKQISEVAREIETLREQVSSKPAANYASPEDLKKLAEAVKEVDRKRMDDNEKIRTEILGLRKILESGLKNVAASKKAAPSPTIEAGTDNEKPANEKGFGYYIVQKGDTLSIIVQAYREKNIRVTTDGIMKANPGLRADRLKVGQKIWIPAPTT